MYGQQQPTVQECLHVMALLILENDTLRIEAGHPSAFSGRREWDHDQLARGADLCPEARIEASGKLVVTIDG